MHLLSSFNLDPEVSSFEQYINSLSSIDFDILFTIANSDLEELSEEDLIDLISLSTNIYCTEMDINTDIILSDSDCVEQILRRFLSTILIQSLINKGLLEKSEDIDITLYKDCSFKPTKIGQLINTWNLSN